MLNYHAKHVNSPLSTLIDLVGKGLGANLHLAHTRRASSPFKTPTPIYGRSNITSINHS